MVVLMLDINLAHSRGYGLGKYDGYKFKPASMYCEVQELFKRIVPIHAYGSSLALSKDQLVVAGRNEIGQA